MKQVILISFVLSLLKVSTPVVAEGEWEITPASEQALARGLQWLARNQGSRGDWDSNDLGLVSVGVLAFLAAGHMPGRGEYGREIERSLEFILRKAKPSGLLNISHSRRDMYNHGLTTFVLGQAYGMFSDRRLSPVLDRALKLIAATQCEDGGWDYEAKRKPKGHDLSLAVMQAKALRSAVDSGLEVDPNVIDLAIQSVREHYRSKRGRRWKDDPDIRNQPGQFTYSGHKTTTAMAACGVVCLQEFGQYDDWRIPKNMDVIRKKVLELKTGRHAKRNAVPFDAYTLYYTGQALYQVGGKHWKDCYPRLRDILVTAQVRDAQNQSRDGSWEAGQHVGGKPGQLYGTAVGCFILAMPNRYLPILQEGRIDSLKDRYSKNVK